MAPTSKFYSAKTICSILRRRPIPASQPPPLARSLPSASLGSGFHLRSAFHSGDKNESEASPWHAVASWTWDAKDETCGICRMAFDGCCPDCKLPGDDCPLIWGQCNHAFHLHCILKWVNSQTSQAHCPMCRGEWHFKD
ncbi:unnamed protein product [Linum tenue]|uniref:Anaphase-promoting complex subunit 11 n=1 Tax=Linum tenue TaxID=586396 RepID=A0AAV0LC98_9ROSI|nr:unnamed protein product [Linum tenue]